MHVGNATFQMVHMSRILSEVRTGSIFIFYEIEDIYIKKILKNNIIVIVVHCVMIYRARKGR